jgi:tetratricopeptide (TPR) repeat protein
MKSVALLLLAVSLGTFWRETNSHAAARRGTAAFEEKRFDQAAAAFGRAQELAPSPRNAFNLGTAQIAAGDREQGSATLGEALKDRAFRADAFYNRGNSALAAKSLDHAVRDYVEALKANPDHLAAKRNLEIALKRRDEERRKSGTPQQQQQRQPPQPRRPTPAPGEQPKPGDLDLEALLRSVQQQEQDELRRMKGKAGEAKVGW